MLSVKVLFSGRIFPAFFLFSCLLLTDSSELCAQWKGRAPPNRQPVGELSEADANDLLNAFRSFQAVPFAASFVLEERPARGPVLRRNGYFLADWSSEVPVTRIFFPSHEGDPEHEWLLWNGSVPQVWKRSGDGPVQELDADQWSAEMMEGFSIQLFDLLMPYLYWKDADYIGSTRYLGRPTQKFILHSNTTASTIQSAELWIDADFTALLRAVFRNAEERITREWNLGSWRKVEDMWMVKHINFRDMISRNTTRIEFVDYAFDLDSIDEWRDHSTLENFNSELLKNLFD